jgi:DNA-binding IclR family transcriptional regulator
MIGKKIPLYCSGVGKAMLADMPEDDVASIWSQSQIQSLTRYTITDYDQFRGTLEEARQNGYALDNEENEIGVRCIAAALKNYNGKPAYALSVSAPKERFADERIPEMRDALLATKTAIEKEMGIAQA